MKQTYLIGATLLLMATGAQAQLTTKPHVGPVHIAPEIGINFNNIAKNSNGNNYAVSDNTKIGYHLGFAVNIGSGRFAVQPGLRYSQKGAEVESNYQDAFIKIQAKNKLTLHYIEMPLNFIYHFGYWCDNRFMIGAGPYVAYLAGAEAKRKLQVKNLSTDAEASSESTLTVPVGENNPASLNRWDAGLGGFLGYQFAGGIYLKAGGQFGLVDLQDQGTVYDPYEARNYNLHLTLGYMVGYHSK